MVPIHRDDNAPVVVAVAGFIAIYTTPASPSSSWPLLGYTHHTPSILLQFSHWKTVMKSQFSKHE